MKLLFFFASLPPFGYFIPHSFLIVGQTKAGTLFCFCFIFPTKEINNDRDTDEENYYSM